MRIRGMKQPVIFRRQDGRNAEVEAGPMRMKIPVGDIVSIERSADLALKIAAPATGRGITVTTRPSVEPSADEINVIGQTVEEATGRVDKFLDAAALAGKSEIRIIHGHGTGALRRGIAEFLSSHPLVASLHSEPQIAAATPSPSSNLRSKLGAELYHHASAVQFRFSISLFFRLTTHVWPKRDHLRIR